MNPTKAMFVAAVAVLALVAVAQPAAAAQDQPVSQAILLCATDPPNNDPFLACMALQCNASEIPATWVRVDGINPTSTCVPG